jgi:hypothetical protein
MQLQALLFERDACCFWLSLAVIVRDPEVAALFQLAVAHPNLSDGVTPDAAIVLLREAKLSPWVYWHDPVLGHIETLRKTTGVKETFGILHVEYDDTSSAAAHWLPVFRVKRGVHFAPKEVLAVLAKIDPYARAALGDEAPAVVPAPQVTSVTVGEKVAAVATPTTSSAVVEKGKATAGLPKIPPVMHAGRDMYGVVGSYVLAHYRGVDIKPLVNGTALQWLPRSMAGAWTAVEYFGTLRWCGYTTAMPLGQELNDLVEAFSTHPVECLAIHIVSGGQWPPVDVPRNKAVKVLEEVNRLERLLEDGFSLAEAATSSSAASSAPPAMGEIDVSPKGFEPYLVDADADIWALTDEGWEEPMGRRIGSTRGPRLLKGGHECQFVWDGVEWTLLYTDCPIVLPAVQTVAEYCPRPECFEPEFVPYPRYLLHGSAQVLERCYWEGMDPQECDRVQLTPIAPGPICEVVERRLPPGGNSGRAIHLAHQEEIARFGPVYEYDGKRFQRVKHENKVSLMKTDFVDCEILECSDAVVFEVSQERAAPPSPPRQFHSASRLMWSWQRPIPKDNPEFGVYCAIRGQWIWDGSRGRAPVQPALIRRAYRVVKSGLLEAAAGVQCAVAEAGVGLGVLRRANTAVAAVLAASLVEGVEARVQAVRSALTPADQGVQIPWFSQVHGREAPFVGKTGPCGRYTRWQSESTEGIQEVFVGQVIAGANSRIATNCLDAIGADHRLYEFSEAFVGRWIKSGDWVYTRQRHEHVTAKHRQETGALDLEAVKVIECVGKQYELGPIVSHTAEDGREYRLAQLRLLRRTATSYFAAVSLRFAGGTGRLPVQKLYFERQEYSKLSYADLSELPSDVAKVRTLYALASRMATVPEELKGLLMDVRSEQVATGDHMCDFDVPTIVKQMVRVNEAVARQGQVKAFAYK